MSYQLRGCESFARSLGRHKLKGMTSTAAALGATGVAAFQSLSLHSPSSFFIRFSAIRVTTARLSTSDLASNCAPSTAQAS